VQFETLSLHDDECGRGIDAALIARTTHARSGSGDRLSCPSPLVAPLCTDDDKRLAKDTAARSRF